MGWRQIGRGRYYYRSVREGGRVRTEYHGKGEMAQNIAKLWEALRVEMLLRREAQRGQRLDDLQRHDDLDELIADANMQAHALLEALGYHYHRGTWRKRRGCLRTDRPAADPLTDATPADGTTDPAGPSPALRG
jgi:hypothetical protein